MQHTMFPKQLDGFSSLTETATGFTCVSVINKHHHPLQQHFASQAATRDFSRGPGFQHQPLHPVRPHGIQPFPQAIARQQPQHFLRPEVQHHRQPQQFAGAQHHRQPQQFAGAQPQQFAGAQPQQFAGAQPQQFTGAHHGQPQQFTGAHHGQPQQFTG
eukprot:Lankesteria_metandrocarpae@DN2611_c0_g1_i1.p1